jgi:hypothetical protein
MSIEKFREIGGNSLDVVINVYQHIDNGGYSISGDEYGTVSIDFSFFGYANTSISLPQLDIDGLIATMQEYKKRLEHIEVMRRLKGE